MTTQTRTHVYITFANPYLVCETCRQLVPRWHNPDQCGCDEPTTNEPCGHQHAGVTSVCPSWGPVDGCECLDHLGYLPHGPAFNQDGAADE